MKLAFRLHAQVRAVACVALLQLCLFGSGAAAGAEVFAGKTIKLIVGFPPGGSHHLYARLISEFFRKHIPGEPTVIVTSMPGAGSLTMVNYIYNAAPKDGTEIGAPAALVPFEAIYKASGVQFDPSRLSWIGSVNKGYSTCSVFHTSKIATIQDLQTMQATFGATGVGSPTFVEARVLNSVLNTKIRLVVGYPGNSDIFSAMERGEIDGACGYSLQALMATRGDMVTSGKLRFLVQNAAERNPSLPNVPLMVDFAKNESQRDLFKLLAAPHRMDKVFIAPPGLPLDRLTILRRAFDDTMKDAEFVSKAKSMHLDVNPSTGEEVEAIFGDIAKISPSVIEEMIKARRE